MGAAAIPELIRLLETRDSTLRRQLTQWTTRGPRPVRRLIHVRLGNSDSAIVREKGAQLLGKLGPLAKAAVPELLRALGDPDMTVATTAAGALSKIGEPAVPGLIAATTSTNQITRHMAVFALGEIGSSARESIPALISRLEDSYPFVQSSASWSLAQMGSNAVAPLIEATTSENPRTWMAAVRVLTNQPSLLRLVIPELEVMAGAADEDQRRKAGKAVIRLELRNRRQVGPAVQ
jgi:HEAT repeat protein